MRTRRRNDLPPCGELRPDDGIDPRTLFRREERSWSRTRDRRLCGQVAEALSLALGELAGNAWTDGLSIVSVEPAPDSSRLKVSVEYAGRDADDTRAAFAQLRGLGAHLRWEVGAAISRRRVPELVFELASVPGGEP